MSRRLVVWHNVSTNGEGRLVGILDGYSPGHALVPVLAITDPVVPWDVEEDDGADAWLCEWVYQLLNIGDDPTFGEPNPLAVEYRTRGNRSLSVGDVVQIGVKWFAVKGAGWTEVDAPAFVALDVTRYGTHSIDLSVHAKH